MVGEENEILFIRVWKPHSSIRVLKALKGSLKGKAQKRGQYLIVVGLNRYKWYQSYTPGDVLSRRLSPKGGGHEVCANKNVGSRRGMNWGVPHRLEKGTSVSEDVGP